MSARIIIAALVLSACQAQPEEEALTARPMPPAVTDTGVVADTAIPDTTAAGKTLSRIPSTPDTTPIVAPRRQVDVPTVAIQELLDSDTYVGKTVRVTGRCLGYGKPVAVGGPPLTRSDWQLEANGVAIYVSGPLPQGCSPTEGATEPTTMLARVEEDTLPALGERPATPRRYLVRIVP